MRRLAIIVVLSLICVTSTAWAYSGGTGEPNDPYQIATAEDLIELGDTPSDYDKCFILTMDIECDLLDPEQEPHAEAIIAPCRTYYDSPDSVGVFVDDLAFTGRFDGNGHVIRNLSLSGSSNSGLFGAVGEGAWIGHLGLEDVWLKGENGIGALAVSVESACVEDCYSTGKIEASESSLIGGLIAYCKNARISDCNSSCEIQGNECVGGLVGEVDSGYLLRCFSDGVVQGQDWTGGLIGYIDGDAAIVQCQSSATVEGNGSVGGLVGLVSRGLLLECHSSGVVQGDHAVGGLVGGGTDSLSYYGSERGQGDLTGCTSSAQVSGRQWVGGLIGYHKAGVAVWCHASGQVAGQDSVGGLVGCNDAGAVCYCYSIGSVTGQTGVGGLVGSTGDRSSSDEVTGLIDNCYTRATVDGNDYVGGLVGLGTDFSFASNSYSASTVHATGDYVGGLDGGCMPVVDCFWDIQQSGIPTSAEGTGLLTSLMATPKAFLDQGWDFVGETANGQRDLWQMPTAGGPPILVPYPPSEDVTFAGLGTRGNPYVITTPSQLQGMRYHPMACYRLDQDIDLSGLSFSAALIPWFAGTLDGQGHTIRSMHIEGSGNLGLFGQLYKDAFVKDVRLLAVDVVVGEDHQYQTISYGRSGNARTITVYLKAYQGSGVGGLAGRNQGHIQGCCVEGAVEGLSVVGGLLGINQGTVISCYSKGSTYALKSNVGGLAGINEGLIANCYCKQSVEGETQVAGLVADNIYGRIQNCYCEGTVSGQLAISSVVGVLVAWNQHSSYCQGQIKDCFWDMHGSIFRNTQWPPDGLWDTRIVGGTRLGSTPSQDVVQLITAEWDYTGESCHGTADYWDANEGGDYPMLRIFRDPNPLAEGQGTEDHPWVLKTANDLGRIWQHPYGHYQLGADIDCNNMTWGMAVAPWFGGTFDGNDCSITNLNIEGAGHLGLFGVLEVESCVSDLKLTHVDVNAVVDASALYTIANPWQLSETNANADLPDWLGQFGNNADIYSIVLGESLWGLSKRTPSTLNVGALAGVCARHGM